MRSFGEHYYFGEDFFFKLPKTDLHVHLDGSLRLETILDLAQKDGIDIGAKDVDELRAVIQPGKVHASLEDYLKGFAITLKVLQTEESLYRVSYELAEDAARENVHYMEVRYSPILHTQKGLSETAIIESVLAGLRDAQADFGIKSGVIVCGMRHVSPNISLMLAELSVAFKNRGVVGFDLAGAENNNPARDHVAAFARILSNNVNVTIHAGEHGAGQAAHGGAPSRGGAGWRAGRRAGGVQCGERRRHARPTPCLRRCCGPATRHRAARPAARLSPLTVAAL